MLWRLLLAVQLCALVALPMLCLMVLLDDIDSSSAPVWLLGWGLAYLVIAIFWLWLVATPILLVLLLLVGMPIMLVWRPRIAGRVSPRRRPAGCESLATLAQPGVPTSPDA